MSDLDRLMFDPTVDAVTAALTEQMKLQVGRAMGLPVSVIDGRPWVATEDEQP